MATVKRRLLRKNMSGTYDIIHLETSASAVILSDGTTVEENLANISTIFRTVVGEP